MSEMRRQIYTFYAGRETKVGFELSEGRKKLDEADFAEYEGRVVVRFFNCSQSKDNQVRVMMEPAEAFDAYLRIMRAVKSPTATKDDMPPHKFNKDGKDILTALGVEKWVRADKSGYALTARRSGGISHNISLQASGILYAAECFRSLSMSAN